MRTGGRAVVLLLALERAAAFDAGAVLENDTTVAADFGQANAIVLWATQVTGPWRLSTQARYAFTTELPVAFDLDLLTVEAAIPLFDTTASLLEATLGRFVAVDPSGAVLRHRLDGLRIGYSRPAGQLSITVGYTGLLFDHGSAVTMSKADSVAKAEAGPLSLAPPRGVAMAELALAELGRQSITVAYIEQHDFRPQAELVPAGATERTSNGGRLHTRYLGASAAGSLAPLFYYDVSAYLGLGSTLSLLPDTDSTTGSSYRNAYIRSGLLSAAVRAYLGRGHRSLFRLGAVYSTGDADSAEFREGNESGSAGTFVPISTGTAPALLFAPDLGNLAYAEAGYAFGQSKRFGLDARIVTFARDTASPIAEPGIDLQSDARYLGTEVDATVWSRPYSDLFLSVTGGLFQPNNGTGGAFVAAERPLQGGIKVRGAFNL